MSEPDILVTTVTDPAEPGHATVVHDPADVLPALRRIVDVERAGDDEDFLPAEVDRDDDEAVVRAWFGIEEIPEPGDEGHACATGEYGAVVTVTHLEAGEVVHCLGGVLR